MILESSGWGMPWGMPMIAWGLILVIPVVAIVGGIVSGIVRTLGRQRIVELAQRERIAAIERGIDPSKLPPLPAPDDDDGIPYGPEAYARKQVQRFQGLLIGGIITTTVGVGLTIMLYVLEKQDPAWIVGILPFLVGLALLLSAWLVRPKPENGAGR